MYQAGLTVNGPKQAAMGMYGALVVYPATSGQAYTPTATNTDTAFDSEALLVLSEIDPALNADPGAFDMQDYAPKYWLINGKSYPDTAPIQAPPGSKVLLRYANAGFEEHSMGLLGMDQSIIAANGFLSPFAHGAVAETVPPASTMDAIITMPATVGEQHPLYDANQHIDNNGAASASGFGGMMTFITVTPAGPPPVQVTVSDLAAGHVVYVFDGTGNWLGAGLNQTTNASGIATFNLPPGDYKFATDMFGNPNYRYWSTPVPCTVPACTAATIDLGITGVDVTVSDLAAGHVVYLFSGDGTTWLGASQNQTTDGTGVAHFSLPTGGYQFATDMFDNPNYRYWSTAAPCAVPACTAATIDLGITGVNVTVSDLAAGHVVYLFSGDGATWLGASQSQTTDGAGVAHFSLPTGSYQFATDMFDNPNYRYWGTPAPCTVPTCTAATIDLGMATVTVTVTDGVNGIDGKVVYVFNGDGTTWLGASLNQTTAGGGLATFNLPAGDYQFASDDVNNVRHWSTPSPCTIAGCTAVTITMP